MLVLGIESSCDETAVAIVADGHRVLSSLISSQLEVHRPFGGVVPELAARAHLDTIVPLFHQALAEAQVSMRHIKAVAVTRGPGLIGALLVGVNFAKAIAAITGARLVPVDHVHAHIHGALLGLPLPTLREIYPGLALVVSGGHTHLYHMEDPLDFRLLARSVDDACGECFDKVAKLLGIGYPGGPEIERLALAGDPSRFPMPKMIDDRSRMVFSYSGLKTFVANTLRKNTSLDAAAVSDLCAAFQHAAFEQLARKVDFVLESNREIRSITVAGGVAANRSLRALLTRHVGSRAKCFFPDTRFCSDNAAMVAAYGYQILQNRSRRETLENLDWDAYSRYQESREVDGQPPPPRA